MARQRMVTRTINVVTYKTVCMDMSDMTNIQTVEKFFQLTGDILAGNKALQTLQKQHDTDTFKVVAIVGQTVSEKMYGMLETDFIACATELDPETRKALEF